MCALLSRLFKSSSVRGGEERSIRCQLPLFPVFLHIIIHRLFNLLSLNENSEQPLSHLPVAEGNVVCVGGWSHGIIKFISVQKEGKNIKDIYTKNTLNCAAKSKGEGRSRDDRKLFRYGGFMVAGCLPWSRKRNHFFEL